MSQDNASWHSLPPELHHLVALSLQHTASLVTMRGACRSMRAAVNQDDVWEKAGSRQSWQLQHAPQPALTPREAFVQAIHAERDSYQMKRRLADRKANAISRQSMPLGAGSSYAVSVLAAPHQYAEIAKLRADCAAIQGAFAQEGLRAKPYSLRQRWTRSMRSQAHVLAPQPRPRALADAFGDRANVADEGAIDALWNPWFQGQGR